MGRLEAVNPPPASPLFNLDTADNLAAAIAWLETVQVLLDEMQVAINDLRAPATPRARRKPALGLLQVVALVG
jgi:hypothetical protein